MINYPTSQKKTFIVLLSLTNLLCLTYFVILAFYGRYHFDDIEMLGMTKRMSLGEFVSFFYQYRSGRFVSYGINWIIYKFIILGGLPWIPPIFFYIAGIAMSWFAISPYFSNTKNPNLLFLSVVFAYNIYILTNLDFPQFTWLCAISGFITFPAVLLFLSLLNKDKLNWYHYLILSLLIVLLGSKESFTPLLLLIMLCNGLYYWKISGWSIQSTWSFPQARRIVITTLPLIVLLVVTIIAPGNFVRLGGQEMAEYETNRSIIHCIIGEAKALTMLTYFLVFNIPYYVILAIVFLYSGSLQSSPRPILTRRLFFGIIIAFLGYMVISAIPQAFLFGGFGYKRNYTHVICATVFVIAGISYLIAQKKSCEHIGWLSFVCLFLVCAAVTYHITIDTPTVRSYSREYDERIAYLTGLQEQGNKDDVYIQPLHLPYTTNIKYDVFKLIGRSKNDRPVLYYVPDQLQHPRALGGFMKDYYGFDFNIILQADKTSYEKIVDNNYQQE